MSEELEQYHQKGGTYVIPVEIMNYWLGEYEHLESVIDKAINDIERFIDIIKKQPTKNIEEDNFIVDILKSFINTLRSKNE